MRSDNEDAPWVLVVEDDPTLRTLIEGLLRQDGLHAEGVANANGLRLWLARRQPDLILLDRLLPDGDGLLLTRDLRQETDISLCMVSGMARPQDRAEGLEAGADDYLGKPFDPRELLARVHALLRRRCGGRKRGDDRAKIRFGPFALDPDRHELRRGSHVVSLTATEQELLEILATHPNRTLDRQYLLDRLRGPGCSAFDRSIDMHIARLRRKLGDHGRHSRYVQTVWGRGYRFMGGRG